MSTKFPVEKKGDKSFDVAGQGNCQVFFDSHVYLKLCTQKVKLFHTVVKIYICVECLCW